VLSFRSETDDLDWGEGSGWFSSLVGIRASLMLGDRRSLISAGYLMPEPGIWTKNPPTKLDALHRALVDCLQIPVDLIEVAAESSVPLRGLDKAGLPA